MKNNPNTKYCYLYILDTLADWEIGFITAELCSRRYFAKHTGFEFLKIGNTMKPVKTMGGMIIMPDKAAADIKFQEGDLLLLPGADTWMNEDNRQILDIVPDLLKKNVTVAAICGATAGLAQIGVLNNRRHTSNDIEYLKMVCPDYKGDSYYRNSPAVTDDNLITASGIAPLEFSYEVFKKLRVMKEETLEAWYHLYKTKEPKYFFSLMESLN